MGNNTPFLKFVFPLLIAASFLIGWFVPAFYDWTGSGQNYSPPLVRNIWVSLAAAVVALYVSLPWLPIGQPAAADSPEIKASPSQFNLRGMLAVTTVLAVVIALLTKFPAFGSTVLCLVAICYVVRFAILKPEYRWATIAMISCMYLPFIWAINPKDQSLEFVRLLLGAPALLPGMLIRVLADIERDSIASVFLTLTSVELVIGTWIVRTGPKRTIALLATVLLLSFFGSCTLNAMIRA